jgi:carbon storage regulator
MLVLSRRRDERILIGDDIEIVVVEVRGEKVRLGINAPTEIAVHRAELRERAKAQIEPKPDAKPDSQPDSKSDPHVTEARSAKAG